MKKSILFLSLLVFGFKSQAQTLETFHDFTVITILGDTVSLSQYAGKKVLCVNTASYCGYTPQFTDLQALDSTYSSYNFEVVGFPCNDFGGQDPHNDSTIFSFCTGIYGVQFDMMSKISITAYDTAEVYKWLQLQSRNGVADAPVTWNFNKYCIDEAGHWVMHFPQTILPFDTAIVNWILSPPVPSGIKSAEINPEIKIKNNPISFYNCKSTDATVSLFSVDGKFIANVFSGKINSKGQVDYNVTNLNNGIYFVRANAGNTIKSFKVCVLH
jgi:glutathione peroxidase